MNNFVQPGEDLTLTAPGGGVVSGGVYKIGGFIGVAAVTAAEGVSFVLRVCGVFDVPKAAGQVWSEGSVVYWSGTAFTTTSGGNTLAGAAYEAAVSAATTGRVRLNGTVV